MTARLNVPCESCGAAAGVMCRADCPVLVIQGAINAFHARELRPAGLGTRSSLVLIDEMRATPSR